MASLVGRIGRFRGPGAPADRAGEREEGPPESPVRCAISTTVLAARGRPRASCAVYLRPLLSQAQDTKNYRPLALHRAPLSINDAAHPGGKFGERLAVSSFTGWIGFWLQSIMTATSNNLSSLLKLTLFCSSNQRSGQSALGRKPHLRHRISIDPGAASSSHHRRAMIGHAMTSDLLGGVYLKQSQMAGHAVVVIS